MSFLQAIGALLLILLVPGLALTLAVHPRARIGLLPRVGLAVAVSISLAEIAAFALSRLPSGLTSGRLVVVLAGVSVPALGVALLRGARPPGRGLLRRPSRATAGAGAAFVLAGAIAAAAVVVSRDSARELDQRGASVELSLVRGDSGNVRDVELTVTNREGGRRDYVLELRSSRYLVKRWTVALQQGETWQRTVTLRAARTVRATLQRAGAPADAPPLRRVSLRAPAVQPAP